MLTDLCGAPVSTGWAASVTARMAAALTGFRTRLAAALGRAAVVGFDETGARVCGRNRWIHVACTPLLTSYHLDDKRGQPAIDIHGVLPVMAAPQVAVHDGWMPYAKPCYSGVDDALCNAHHLRELAGWAEHDPTGHAWANTLAGLLRQGHHLVKRAKADGHDLFEPDTPDDLHRRWDTAIEAAYAANPPPAGTRRGPVLSLTDRLHGYTTEVWRFAHDFTVPFDNNQAERDIRMIKLQVKSSGTWRTTPRRPQLATRPRIHQHRNQKRSPRPDRTPRRHHRQPWMPPLPE